mmetsp:Transcript_39527/g.73373  ORF Transcript_39527/g.73373 Transcript_39527/m.73373 type:complete len:80 (+) Transcript_39527:1215-1454(+)
MVRCTSARSQLSILKPASEKHVGRHGLEPIYQSWCSKRLLFHWAIFEARLINVLTCASAERCALQLHAKTNIGAMLADR